LAARIARISGFAKTFGRSMVQIDAGDDATLTLSYEADRF
jgi:hypothetical protein